MSSTNIYNTCFCVYWAWWNELGQFGPINRGTSHKNKLTLSSGSDPPITFSATIVPFKNRRAEQYVFMWLGLSRQRHGGRHNEECGAESLQCSLLTKYKSEPEPVSYSAVPPHSLILPQEAWRTVRDKAWGANEFNLSGTIWFLTMIQKSLSNLPEIWAQPQTASNKSCHAAFLLHRHIILTITCNQKLKNTHYSRTPLKLRKCLVPLGSSVRFPSRLHTVQGLE